MLTLTNVYDRNFEAFMSFFPNGEHIYKYIVNQGGTSSSKTFSILQLLTAIALFHNKHIEIVGLSVPHLKSGVLNDMPAVFEQFGLNFYSMYNMSDKFVLFNSGGRLQFTAFDNIGKAHGGRRDILYLNEANHLEYRIVEQLMARTRDCIFIDYNPTNAFWVHNQLQVTEPDKVKLIKSNYKDNQYLEQSIIDFIESRKGDGNNNFWRVYGLGELGVAEGLVFDNVEARAITDEEIARFDRIREGIDWGFAVDPFVWVKGHFNRKQRTLYIFDEIFKVGLSNEDAIQRVWARHTRSAEIVADSEEPKSIYDFQNAGLPVVKARKGAGSVSYGMKKLQGLIHIYIDPARCPNTYREFTSYAYDEDKNGEYKSQYPDKDNHTIDATRYMLQDDFEY